MKEVRDAVKVLIGSGITASWFLGIYVHNGFFAPAGIGSFLLALGIVFWAVENWSN